MGADWTLEKVVADVGYKPVGEIASIFDGNWDMAHNIKDLWSQYSASKSILKPNVDMWKRGQVDIPTGYSGGLPTTTGIDFWDWYNHWKVARELAYWDHDEAYNEWINTGKPAIPVDGVVPTPVVPNIVVPTPVVPNIVDPSPDQVPDLTPVPTVPSGGGPSGVGAVYSYWDDFDLATKEAWLAKGVDKARFNSWRAAAMSGLPIDTLEEMYPEVYTNVQDEVSYGTMMEMLNQLDSSTRDPERESDRLDPKGVVYPRDLYNLGYRKSYKRRYRKNWY